MIAILIGKFCLVATLFLTGVAIYLCYLTVILPLNYLIISLIRGTVLPAYYMDICISLLT